MNDVTWFGWLYLSLAAVGVVFKVWQIGRPREPVDHTEAIIAIVTSALYVWALLTVGVRA